MRLFYITLGLSLMAHTLVLFTLSSLPKISMPSSDTQTIVLSINSGSAGSGSLSNQGKQTPSGTTKEPANSNKKNTTQKNQPVKTETQTPKVLQTKPNQKATVTNSEQTPSSIEPTDSKVLETSKSQTKESHKSALSDYQGDSSSSGKQGGSGSQQGNQGAGQSVGGGNGKITPPIPTYAPEPAYPNAAGKLQQLGTVHISLKIDATGKVTDTTVTQSSQFPLLDNAAKRKLKSWRFKAAQQEGNAIPATVNIKILFTPEGVKVLR